MIAAALLDELTQRGVRLSANGDRLHVKAPAGVPTSEVRAELRSVKAELLGLLAVHRAWAVSIPGLPAFVMLDPQGCTRADAEHVVHLRWPNATVEPCHAAP